MSKDQNFIDMEQVEGDFMKDGDELHLKADKGRIDRGAKTVYIEGNVEGYGRDGEELYAENLTYDGNKDILSTDKAFVVKKDGKVLTADEFDADRVLQKITARGHAKLAEEEGQSEILIYGAGSSGYFCRRFWKRYGRRYYGRCADL